VQRPDDRVGDAQRRADHAVALRQQRTLLRGRARGDRQRGAPRVDHRETRVERLGGRAHDFGQAGAGLDRLRNRVKRRQI
jgi:hypothetical protein